MLQSGQQTCWKFIHFWKKAAVCVGKPGLLPPISACNIGAAGNFHTCSHRSLPVVPELTSVRYPYLKRGPYSRLNDSDVNFFKGLLSSPGQVLTADDELDTYNIDWMHIYKGSSQLVLRPKSVQEISEILKYCSAQKLAVVPQGGNTGLVGGSVPVFDEIVVSMQLMSKIIHFDNVAGILMCEAGCILEKLDEHVSQDGFMMPLDLGAKGSCMIGGNLSTNAGGIRLLRYGSLQGNVLGLEAVTFVLQFI